MKIAAEGVGWQVGGTTIVDGVTFDVSPGEMFGLVGPNGSGKSTLLKMLAGIRPPSAGRIALADAPLETLSRRRIAQTVAFVEQFADTVDRITVRDAVELGRTPWLSALAPWSARDEAAVSDALASVDMTRFAARSWHTLSGGERQRVHIARALAQHPAILVLDEPTNHLDIHHQLSILTLIRRLRVTTIVALHDLNQAMNCDRVGIMDQGRLVAVGTPHEVLTADRIEATFAIRTTICIDPSDGTRLLRFHNAT
ncbi:ABC transporter ATP-binding protein [Acuticoccus sp. M5D2P5]|uniref:ABC transporter ATP-binding protein n=1 Tax=Acuticoccus kalidii TaxID=2910977 RepID=UPI001F41D6D3|nr:ABC transporter ATP-binding protein [Acuticoccus kalidii]MCF3934559.1 ABC transporter ATP-binding protein [Acuticoccus kalidii]